MADPALTMPEWVTALGALVGTAAAVFVAKLGMQAGNRDKQANDKVVGLVASAPIAERHNQELLITTLTEIRVILSRLLERMEDDERERREDEKDEVRELRAEASILRRQLQNFSVEYKDRK